MSVLRGPLVLVDVETTGTDFHRGRVIEVGAIRIENGKVVDRLNTLLNPEIAINPFIANLTNINPDDLEKSPYFSDIAERLYDILDGAIFVVHNAQFDFGFIRSEFERLGKPFKAQKLCTVKLSRALYPEHRRHSLENIIERFQIKVARRHRAYDDAMAMWEFIKCIERDNTVESIEQAIALQLKRPSLPTHLSEGLVSSIPDGPGVYIFEDEQGRPLYIGKSVHLKKRVLSHFAQSGKDNKEHKIAQAIQNITVHSTSGELEALLLEAQLVKEMQPLYNRKLRRLSKVVLATKKLDVHGYINVSFDEVEEINPEASHVVLGVFQSRGKAKSSITELCKLFDLCPRLLGLEKGQGACFYSQLKKCKGACSQKESAAEYNRRLMTAFDLERIQTWPYKGPVLLEEKALDEGSSGVVIDQWCVIAQVKSPAYADATITPLSKRFDLDTYKILRGFLARKRPSVHITPLNRHQLSGLLNSY